jgi:hypothetical protein
METNKYYCTDCKKYINRVTRHLEKHKRKINQKLLEELMKNERINTNIPEIYSIPGKKIN